MALDEAGRGGIGGREGLQDVVFVGCCQRAMKFVDGEFGEVGWAGWC